MERPSRTLTPGGGDVLAGFLGGLWGVLGRELDSKRWIS